MLDGLVVELEKGEAHAIAGPSTSLLPKVSRGPKVSKVPGMAGKAGWGLGDDSPLGHTRASTPVPAPPPAGVDESSLPLDFRLSLPPSPQQLQDVLTQGLVASLRRAAAAGDLAAGTASALVPELSLALPAPGAAGAQPMDVDAAAAAPVPVPAAAGDAAAASAAAAEPQATAQQLQEAKQQGEEAHAGAASSAEGIAVKVAEAVKRLSSEDLGRLLEVNVTVLIHKLLVLFDVTPAAVVLPTLGHTYNGDLSSCLLPLARSCHCNAYHRMIHIKR